MLTADGASGALLPSESSEGIVVRSAVLALGGGAAMVLLLAACYRIGRHGVRGACCAPPRASRAAQPPPRAKCYGCGAMHVDSADGG
eukprot:5412307-Prymnesium_polylepis.1